MAGNADERRDIKLFDLVDVMTDPPSVQEISNIIGTGGNARIYLRPYLIKPESFLIMSIEFNNTLNKWILEGTNIEAVFHPRPDFPESDEALTYLREFVTGDLFGFRLSTTYDQMVYGDSNNRDEMIESATRYWQKMIFNDGLNTYVKSLVENISGIGGISVMYRDGNNNLVIIPEYVKPLKKIYMYLYGRDEGTITNEEALELARKIDTVKNEYMMRTFVPVKSAMKR